MTTWEFGIGRPMRRESGSIFTPRLKRAAAAMAAALPRVPQGRQAAIDGFIALEEKNSLGKSPSATVFEFAADRATGMVVAAARLWPDSAWLAALSWATISVDEIRAPPEAARRLAELWPTIETELFQAIEEERPRLHALPLLIDVGVFFSVSGARALVAASSEDSPSVAVSMLADTRGFFFALHDLAGDVSGVGKAADDDPGTQGLIQALTLDTITFAELAVIRARTRTADRALRLNVLRTPVDS
jgi:nucleoid-associated protein YgaU